MMDHLNASINVGQAAGVDREIRMLSGDAAGDTQSSTWFNLAMAYMSKGAMSDAVDAMDRAIFYLLRVSAPGAVVHDEVCTQAAIEEMQVNVPRRQAAGGGGDGRAGGSAADRGVRGQLLELKELANERRADGPFARPLHVWPGAAEARPRAAGAGTVPTRGGGGAAQADFLSLKMIPEMLCRLAGMEKPRGDTQREMMLSAVEAAAALGGAAAGCRRPPAAPGPAADVLPDGEQPDGHPRRADGAKPADARQPAPRPPP